MLITDQAEQLIFPTSKSKKTIWLNPLWVVWSAVHFDVKQYILLLITTDVQTWRESYNTYSVP